MALKKTWKHSGRRMKGVWPFRYEWFSICSAHQRWNPTCNLCNGGAWVNTNRQAIGSFVYKRWPNLWRRWVNRNNPHYIHKDNKRG